MPHNRVYIATSLDGYIADIHGKVGFLDIFHFPEGDDMGYADFMSQTDAILMGRKSFETVLGFGVDWPYTKPVFVWSRSPDIVPAHLASRVQVVGGSVSEVLKEVHNQGFINLYIDGGVVIRSFLREDLVDEMTITTIPVILGEGIPLFGPVDEMLKFRCLRSKAYGNGVSQSIYKRISD